MKYYVVRKGRKCGVLDNWTECSQSVTWYACAQYKSFPTLSQAREAFEGEYENFKWLDLFEKKLSPYELNKIVQPDPDSICVDAACSGNPWILEYRWVDTSTWHELFLQWPFVQWTVNIGEFLAIIDGMRWLIGRWKRENTKTSQNMARQVWKNMTHDTWKETHDSWKKRLIYSDSKTAIAWIKAGQVNTKLKKTKKNNILFDRIQEAVDWLKNNNTDIVIAKWRTSVWWEIPADFGRK